MPSSTARRLARVGLAVASALILVMTVVSAGVSVVMNQLQGNITAIDISEDVGPASDSSITAVNEDTGNYEPLNIVLMGSDTRAGKGNGGFGSVTKFGTAQRSDTVILLHIAADRKSAIGVSIPRDTIIDLPTCKHDGKQTGGYQGRFNQAIEIGGPGCTIKAINQMTGLDVSHFMLVDFGGFKRIVDAIGGVEICLAAPVNDKLSGLNLSKGNHLVQGDEALAFVRVRHGIGDGSDTSRIRRQQAFISSMMKKVLSSGTLLNPASLLSVLDAATKSLTADTQLANINNLKDLAVSLKDLKPSNVTFVTVPWTPNGDGATVSVNQKKAAPLWAALKNDTPWPPVGSKTAADGTNQPLLKTKPENIRVTVLNGTSQAGLAKKVARQLKKQGYIVEEVGNADADTYTATKVQYDPNWDVSAKTLIYATSATDTEAVKKQGQTMNLIVGTDWSGVLPVKINAITSDYTANVNTADEQFCAQ